MGTTMTRRKFGQAWATFLLALSVGPSLLVTGCGTSFSTILSWVDTGLAAFQSVVDLLAGQSVINITIGSAIDLIIKAVKAAIADIGTAVSNYNAAPAAAKATLVGKISTALVAAQNEISQFWNDLTIPDAKVASTVAGLLGLIVSTLAGFMSLLPPAPAPAALRTFPKTLAGAAPQKRSLPQFKAAFNGILDTNGYSQYKRF
jgi:hypothetical protein